MWKCVKRYLLPDWLVLTETEKFSQLLFVGWSPGCSSTSLKRGILCPRKIGPCNQKECCLPCTLWLFPHGWASGPCTEMLLTERGVFSKKTEQQLPTELAFLRLKVLDRRAQGWLPLGSLWRGCVLSPSWAYPRLSSLRFFTHLASTPVYLCESAPPL